MRSIAELSTTFGKCTVAANLFIVDIQQNYGADLSPGNTSFNGITWTAAVSTVVQWRAARRCRDFAMAETNKRLRKTTLKTVRPHSDEFR